MSSESGHQSVPLAKSEFGSIDRCRCDGYHVSLRNIMLHFNREEFAALSDLFERAQEREEEAVLFSKWEG
ncbi:MAG: hypothetical protein LLH30_13900 [Candidatus Manganitrophus sp. SA1]|nr:hypothetical protein [Candidatus Manganitrophus morganii]